MRELEEQTHPEILRSNLANTVLELMKLGIEVRHIEFTVKHHLNCTAGPRSI